MHSVYIFINVINPNRHYFHHWRLHFVISYEVHTPQINYSIEEHTLMYRAFNNPTNIIVRQLKNTHLPFWRFYILSDMACIFFINRIIPFVRSSIVVVCQLPRYSVNTDCLIPYIYLFISKRRARPITWLCQFCAHPYHINRKLNIDKINWYFGAIRPFYVHILRFEPLRISSIHIYQDMSGSSKQKMRSRLQWLYKIKC